jgi:hypothetical protein
MSKLVQITSTASGKKVNIKDLLTFITLAEDEENDLYVTAD